jgi:hypothetical protein
VLVSCQSNLYYTTIQACAKVGQTDDAAAESRIRREQYIRGVAAESRIRREQYIRGVAAESRIWREQQRRVE